MNRRYRAGQPAPQQFHDSAYESDSTEQPGDLAWLAWLLIAAMLTATVMFISYVLGRWLATAGALTLTYFALEYFA